MSKLLCSRFGGFLLPTAIAVRSTGHPGCCASRATQAKRRPCPALRLAIAASRAREIVARADQIGEFIETAVGTRELRLRGPVLPTRIHKPDMSGLCSKDASGVCAMLPRPERRGFRAGERW
ncbi:MAG: hypothetical protein OEV08_00630 [Nitrospira sp.]|nr:hypothetical protein [Nitrospira sp.]